MYVGDGFLFEDVAIKSSARIGRDKGQMFSGCRYPQAKRRFPATFQAAVPCCISNQCEPRALFPSPFRAKMRAESLGGS